MRPKYLQFLLALGTFLTASTRMRMQGFPVGPGELLLVFVIVIILIDRYIGQSTYKKVVLIHSHMSKFWKAALSIMIFATLFNVLFGIEEAGQRNAASFKATGLEAEWNPIRDIIAFLFLAIIFSLITLDARFNQNMSKVIEYFIVISSIVLGALYWSNVLLGSKSLFGFPAWDGERFTGLSFNANSTALQLVLCPAFLLYMIRNPQYKNAAKFFFALLLISSVFTGMATGSDALVVSWILGGGVFMILLMIRSRISLLKKFMITSSLLVCVFAFGDKVFNTLNTDGQDIYNANAQGDIRVSLWKNGIIATMSAPLWGLGGGSHSGILTPFAGSECHNTFVDWFTSTGLIGLYLYFALLLFIVRLAWQAKQPILIAVFILLLGFSVFHYVLRHPSYWLYLSFIALESERLLKQMLYQKSHTSSVAILKQTLPSPQIANSQI